MFNLFKKNKKTDELKVCSYEEELLSLYGKAKVLDKHIKILFFSDTHGCFDSNDIALQISDFDICILLGDHASYEVKQIAELIPKEKLWGLLGNHDFLDLYENNNIPSLNGRVIEINGIKIGGIQGCTKYKNFEEKSPKMLTHEEGLAVAKQIEDIDILVSHDRAWIKDNKDAAHDGMKGITECIYRNSVSYHIHGHIHNENEEILINGTKSKGIFRTYLFEI